MYEAIFLLKGGQFALSRKLPEIKVGFEDGIIKHCEICRDFVNYNEDFLTNARSYPAMEFLGGGFKDARYPNNMAPVRFSCKHPGCVVLQEFSFRTDNAEMGRHPLHLIILLVRHTTLNLALSHLAWPARP